MHILPPLETVKDIAATQQYDVLPLSCEILSDFITPIEAMRILKNVSTHCYMLESAQADDRWGRYTFLGFDPKLEITCIDGKMKAGGLTVRTDDPSQYLRELLSSYRSPRFDYLPSFTGGLVGYFSYDYLKYSEPSVRCGEQDEDSFKDVDLMLFDKVIAFDHVRQKIALIVNMALSDVEVGYNKAKLELEQLVSLLKTGEKKQEAPGRLLGEATPLFSKEQFCAMVETAKHHIREGDIFQIVLHGMKSYFCQDEYGQIAPVYSISAGLDYPGVGPEHAYLHDIGRAEYVAITDEEAVQAFEYLARTEGIIPAIESAHAVAYARKLAPTMGSDQLLVVTISGRGWTGAEESGKGSGNSTEPEEMVFVTESGSVYHTKASCRYLNLSITQVSGSSVSQRRNDNGEKYSPCETCSRHQNPSGTVYITGSGNRYHNDASCSGLKRTVRLVKKSQLGDMHVCSKCG